MEFMTKIIFFSKNMIVKTINIQVTSVYESIFVRNIIHITFLFTKNPPKISKEEEVIRNMIKKQLLRILKYILNRSIGYHHNVLFRKYTLHD